MSLTTAEEAFSTVLGPEGAPLGEASAFVCAHCGAFAQHLWGVTTQLYVDLGDSHFRQRYVSSTSLITFAQCQVCQRETIFVGGRIVYPEHSDAPSPAPDTPPEVFDDFEEARQIYGKSPRGAAALLRLCIQKLCPLLGAQAPDINRAIGELVAAGTISPAVQQALDSVRVIGNEAVHPGTMDLKDDRQTARSLFNLVNFIVEKGITEPKQIAEIYGGLPPSKLAGIVARDANS